MLHTQKMIPVNQVQKIVQVWFENFSGTRLDDDAIVELKSFITDAGAVTDDSIKNDLDMFSAGKLKRNEEILATLDDAIKHIELEGDDVLAKLTINVLEMVKKIAVMK